MTGSGGADTTIRDVTVVGFGSCLSGNAPGLTVDDFSADCDTGVSVIDNDAPRMNNFVINPLLTGGDIAVLALDSAFTQFTPDGSGQYQIVVDVNTAAYPNFSLYDGDTIWVAPQSGAQSGAGRWTVSCGGGGAVCPAPSSPCAVPGCQQLSLKYSYDSMTSPMTVTGTLFASGYAPNAISGVDFTTVSPGRGSFLSAGQIVSDTASCVDTSYPGTTVTAVWPARGMVFLSRPVTASCPGGSDTFHFKDAPYSDAGAGCNNGTQGSATGCVVVDASYRFGDGFYARNSGGFRLSKGSTFEHGIGFHMDTGSRGDISDTAAGNNVGLADRNLAALHDTTAPDPNLIGNIITLLVEGEHSATASGGSTLDACAVHWTNGVLGQHRNNGIVVQSNCDDPNKFANIGLGVDNHTGNGVALEVDAGVVLMANSDSGTGGNLFKADQTALPSSSGGTISPNATLRISSNEFPKAPLYLANTAAGASTSGCGNNFQQQTPYLCAPSSFTQLPGGRLTLVQSQPVMQSDVMGAGSIYYAPYLSQQVPIYNSASGSFGLTDIGTSGLTLNLSTSVQAVNNLYDVYVDTLSGSGPELCTGPAWSSSGVGSSSRSAAYDVTPVNGVWVNQKPLSCTHGSTIRNCPTLGCTYVGTIYISMHDGQVSQQFNPSATGGGAGPCLCVYNAYNRVMLTSQTRDSNSYSYGLNTWRRLDASTGNSITFVDGSAQMQVSAQLTDALKNGSSTSGMIALIGIEPDISPTGSVPGAPAVITQANSTTIGTYNGSFTTAPKVGLRNVQAVESAGGTPSSNVPTFGGANMEQLSLQVAD